MHAMNAISLWFFFAFLMCLPCALQHTAFIIDNLIYNVVLMVNTVKGEILLRPCLLLIAGVGLYMASFSQKEQETQMLPIHQRKTLFRKAQEQMFNNQTTVFGDFPGISWPLG